MSDKRVSFGFYRAEQSRRTRAIDSIDSDSARRLICRATTQQAVRPPPGEKREKKDADAKEGTFTHMTDKSERR